MAERTSYPRGPSRGPSWRPATPTPRKPSTASSSGGPTTTTRSATGRCTRWRSGTVGLPQRCSRATSQVQVPAGRFAALADPQGAVFSAL